MTDHVEVDVGHRVLERPERMPDPVAGAELAFLFAGPEREDERALRPVGAAAKALAISSSADDAGGVVVGAGVDDVAHAPRWSMCAPRTTASSRSFGSEPARNPTTFRLVTSRSVPPVRSVTVTPGSALGFAARAEARSRLAGGEDGVGSDRGHAHERQRFGVARAVERQEEPRLDRARLGNRRVAKSSPSTASTATAPAARAVSCLASQRSPVFSAP